MESNLTMCNIENYSVNYPILTFEFSYISTQITSFSSTYLLHVRREKQQEINSQGMPSVHIPFNCLNITNIYHSLQLMGLKALIAKTSVIKDYKIFNLFFFRLKIG